MFSIPEDVTTTTTSSGTGSKATFGTSDAPIKIYEGSFLTKRFTYDGSLDQKFILNNSFIDTSTIVVFVGDREYKKVDNILRVNKDSEIFLLQEVQDEKYEILFGDGLIGKELENDANITVSYITTNGTSGNGPAFFSFAGNVVNSTEVSITPVNTPNIVTITSSSNGGDFESIDSI